MMEILEQNNRLINGGKKRIDSKKDIPPKRYIVFIKYVGIIYIWIDTSALDQSGTAVHSIKSFI